MKTQDFKMTNETGKVMVKVNVENENDIDEIAFKMIKKDCPSFIAAFSSVEINGKTTLRYDLGNMISLEYFSSKLSKMEFTTIWNNLLVPLVQCKNWLLRYNSFCFDPKYVFIDRYTLQIKYIYLPLDSAKVEQEEIKALFVGMMNRCELVDGQDLQIQLYKFFANQTFSISELQEIIVKHMNIKINSSSVQPEQQPNVKVYAQQPIPVAPQPVPAVAPIAAPKHQEKPAVSGGEWLPQDSKKLTPQEQLERELLGNLVGDNTPKPEKKSAIKPEKPVKEKKPLFGFGKSRSAASSVQPVCPTDREIMRGAANNYKNSPVPVPVPVQKAVKNNLIMADECTEMLGESISSSTCLILAKQLTTLAIPRKFELDFSNGGVTVGRVDTSKAIKQSDIEFPSSVKSVSRIHARLEKQNEEYFVVDLGSVNGTFVNSQRIPANIPTAIKSGDCIGFSDKDIDYIFKA